MELLPIPQPFDLSQKARPVETPQDNRPQTFSDLEAWTTSRSFCGLTPQMRKVPSIICTALPPTRVSVTSISNLTAVISRRLGRPISMP